MSKHDPEANLLRATVAQPAAVEPGTQALRRMVAQLVLDTTNEGIWLIDAQSRTTFVNPAIAELLGYAEHEMLGRHVFDFLDPSRHPTAAQNLMARRAGLEARTEVQLRRKDGTLVWVIGSANPVYDRNGKYAGALAVLGDLGAQKELEGQLRAEVDRLRDPAGGGAPQPARSAVREIARVATVTTLGATLLGFVGMLAIAGAATSLLPRREEEAV